MPKKKSKIHIACFDDGHIVPRMMSWLVDGLGWTIGPYLNTGVDVNYYAPYTMYGRFGPIGGKSAGWFTHKESGNPAKMTVWDNARKRVTMPLVTAKIYQAELGATLITPGIDQDHFKPTRKKYPSKGIVGIAGQPGPRKGVELAAMLPSIKAVKKVRAIGGDWGNGINSQIVDYADIPAFYYGLDLFVCTSLEEGVPAPPLEALACGVPVLIPAGVGMLDDLPHGNGIYRYAAGDSDEMAVQIELILGGAKHSRATLREYVAPYTKEAWVESNRAAIEKLLHV